MQHHLFKGTLYMLGAMFSFVSVNAIFKTLEFSYHPLQVVFFRYFFALIPCLILLWARQEGSSLKISNFKPHILRGAIGVVGLLMLFQSLSLLPLAEAVTISFASSFFITIFSWILLKERVSLVACLAILMGFAGVIIVAKPDNIHLKLGVVCGLLSAIAEGFILIHSRLISATNSSSAIAFYYALFAAIFAALGLPVVWTTPSTYDLIVLIVLGIGGGIGQYLLITATRLAPAQTLAPLIYSQIVWSILYDIILFDAIPSKSLYTGCGLIIAAGSVMILKDKIIQIKQTN